MKLVLAFFSLLMATAVAASIWVYEIDSDVYMRRKPDNKAKILRTMTGGERVQIVEKTNEFWWKVKHEEKEGYVAASFTVVVIPETALNMAQAAWVFVVAYPAIIGIVLFLLVFGIIRKVQKRINRKSSSG